MNAIGNENLSYGHVKFYYHNMHIRLLKNGGTEKTKLLKIFTHLINNSIIHNNKREGVISIYATEENNIVQFTIKDDGPVIKQQYFEKVFEIFHTLQPKDKFETSGVGLSIVKKIVESFGQNVWFEETTTGTSVNFTWSK